MDSIYCGPCDHIDHVKKRCKVWGVSLACVKHRGAVGYTAFERCGDCWEFGVQNKKREEKNDG